MVKELISYKGILQLCYELNTMTIDYINSVINFRINCEEIDVEKYLSLGKKYGLNTQVEKHDDYYIVVLNFYDYI